MSKSKIIIREIQPNDNTQIEAIIKACFIEFDIPLEGTAYTDIETTKMYESYQKENEKYFVIANDTEVFGGGGIKSLNDFDGTVCELQKMYFSPNGRGLGLGKQLIKTCLKFAKEAGFKQCYLESASQLKAAIHIYETNNFKHLDKPLGNTGHYSCGIWMLKTL